MMVSCPHCKSTQVVIRNHTRKVGGTIGAIAGAPSGFSAAMKGARIGGMLGGRIGLIAGPSGAALGSVTGTILGGLLGGTTGCSVGAALGELIDDKVLHNHRCLDCGCTFGEASAGYRTHRPSSFDESDTGGRGAHPFGRSEDNDASSASRLTPVAGSSATFLRAALSLHPQPGTRRAIALVFPKEQSHGSSRRNHGLRRRHPVARPWQPVDRPPTPRNLADRSRDVLDHRAE